MTLHTDLDTLQAVERRCDVLSARIEARGRRMANMNPRTVAYVSLAALNAADNRQIFELRRGAAKHG